MRRADPFIESLFSIEKLEDFVPASHPATGDSHHDQRRSQSEALLADMNEAPGKGERPGIIPRNCRIPLLQVRYPARPGRLLMEQAQGNLLFRWFIGLSMDDEVYLSFPNKLFTRGEARWRFSSHINFKTPRMNTHKNALLTPKGRARLVAQIARMGLLPAAKAAGISARSARKW